MSRYEYSKRKTRREKIGFYTAFAICLIAVCMAVYSTYNTVSQPKAKPVSKVETGIAAVAEPVTNITVPVPETTLPAYDYTIPTATSEPDSPPAQTDSPTEATSPNKGRPDALQTMLAAEVSLNMPTKSGHVLREYSKESVYYKTINSWKPHTGVDFDGELGDEVLAMLGGEVKRVTDDKMYGKTVEVEINNVTVGYSGMGEVGVKKGDRVERGDKLGTIGVVPIEADDKNHIHVYIRVNGDYADPLSFIENDD